MVRAASAAVAALLATVLVAGGPPPAAPQDPPRVLLIATGGTIANRPAGRLSADELVAMVPDAARHATVIPEQFANVPSAALSLDQWLQLARRVNAAFASPDPPAAIVITSGTDTLEELAYFLHLTVRSERPVVLVGAMRPPGSPRFDGAANLRQAIRVAADPASRGKGALVVLDGSIGSAREIAKQDAARLDAFQSGPYGWLGSVDEDRVAYHRTPVRRHTVQSEFDPDEIESLPRVDVLLVYQDAPGDLVRAAVTQGAQGLVIAAAGAGAVSGSQREAAAYAAEHGVPLVVSSRTGAGRVPSRPAAGPTNGEGGSASGPVGIAADDLPPLKARVLLMLALTVTRDAREIQRMFLEY